MKIARREVSGILLYDKPLGLSSNQALQQVKRLFRADKAGHTGSLDPLATGMLPICFGAATRLCGYLLDSSKRYRAWVQLGARTATGDAEGEVIERSDPGLATRAALEAVLPRFVGPITQVPPMYSALKHEGERLYALARQGIEVERAARMVEIHELRVENFAGGAFELEVHCSKGTYIRTLAEDLARAAGQCAHLAGLRRLEVAPFHGRDMVGRERLQHAAGESEPALDRLLLPAAAALAGWPQIAVDSDRARRLAHGQTVAPHAEAPQGRVAVLDEGGELLGIAESGADGRLVPRRWFA
ncbi:MAG TPA: tRNA pseudouridine(55) synthase TruB [Solimonas sp.]|nr:tRNA pseudouridine(55) synthase TruB [Solimonas sp.]